MSEGTIDKIATEIDIMLNDKGAYRETLPAHLDKDKFRWLVRRDIKTILSKQKGGEQ